MQPMVAMQSPDGKKPITRLSPAARLPSISARCEIDLSPGTRAVPRRETEGEMIQRLDLVVGSPIV
jgi:hypothetical protein